MSSIGPVVSEKKMFENVDGRCTTDAGVIGILLAEWAKNRTKHVTCRPLGKRAKFIYLLFNFSRKTYVVGTQKNSLIDMALSSTQKIC